LRVIPKRGQIGEDPAEAPGAEGGDVLHEHTVDCTTTVLLSGTLSCFNGRLHDHVILDGVSRANGGRPVSVYEGGGRDVAGLQLPLIGCVTAGGEPGLPFAVVDAAGRPVAVISEFLRDMAAGDMPASSCRSYAYELLAWFRPVNCTKSW
jgi:hypothetical protein